MAMQTTQKCRRKLHELTDVHVSFVSLVDRGANRLPFKIIKQEHSGENTMHYDLSMLGLRRKATKTEKAAPVVTAIMVDTTVDCAEVREALTGLGLSVDKVSTQKSEEMEVNIYAQTEEAGDQFVRVADGVVVVCKGLDFSAVPATFADKLNANLYNSVGAAQDALREAMWSAMYESHSHEELVSKCSGIVDEFSAYMKDLVAKIPQSIVKAEVALRDALLTHEAVAKADITTASSAAEGTEAVAAEGEGADAPAAAAVVEEATAAAPAVQEGGEQAPVLKAEDIKSMMQELLTPLADRIGAIEQSVNSAADTVNSVKQEVQEVRTVAESAKKAVTGTVIGQPATEHPSTVQKKDSDTDGGTGVQDTAYQDTRKRRL